MQRAAIGANWRSPLDDLLGEGSGAGGGAGGEVRLHELKQRHHDIRSRDDVLRKQQRMQIILNTATGMNAEKLRLQLAELKEMETLWAASTARAAQRTTRDAVAQAQQQQQQQQQQLRQPASPEERSKAWLLKARRIADSASAPGLLPYLTPPARIHHAYDCAGHQGV